MKRKAAKKLSTSESLREDIAVAQTPAEILSAIRNWEKHLPRPSKDELRSQKIARLEQYIELANKFPPDLQVFDIRALLRERVSSLLEGTTEYDIRKFRFLLNLMDEPETPSDFRGYIVEGVSKAAQSLTQQGLQSLRDSSDLGYRLFSELDVAFGRYDEFREVRERLRTIARMKRARMFVDSRSVSVRSSLTRDKNGILQLHLDPFAEIVEGLEADRIRECPVCQRIFWANPKSKMACSPRCRNLFNVRKHRDLMKKNKVRK
jgi:hypothetical protein